MSTRPRSRFLFALIAMTVGAAPILGQEAVRPSKQPTKKPKTQAARPTAVIDVWTCAMHPQVRTKHGGKCPICAMQLVTTKHGHRLPRPTLNLEEMLAIALKHNPEIRAARARVDAALAELEVTRLTVMRQLKEFRQHWQDVHSELKAAEQEFADVQKAIKANPKSTASKQLLRSAEERKAVLQEKLRDVKAEIPFLLGRPAMAVVPRNMEKEKALQKELLARAQTLVKLRTQEYTKGEANMSQVAAAMRQVGELEIKTARTSVSRIAALQSQKQLMQSLGSIAKKRYQAGQATQADVLVIELEVAKLDLQLARLKK